ncbi:MAG: hypothetical protein IPJ68_00975 [Candidatus Moraniibacteriota bacterium]|nr:MAG: hypothetical protein IPJ68_00975 [Candidatus Moranbacteria bacterium]
MNGLRPGDVLTNLNCGGCQNRQILVLARAGDYRYDFSVRADEVKIIRDSKGPWRWVEHEQVFRNSDGLVHDHIGTEIEVREGAGLRELQWYRELPSPGLVRFHIDPRGALGSFRDPSTEAKLEAIVNRSDDNDGFARDLQQAVELIFAGSTDAVDERRMRYLVSLVHAVGQKLGRDRQPGAEDILMSILMGGEGFADLLGAAGRAERHRAESNGATRRSA